MECQHARIKGEAVSDYATCENCGFEGVRCNHRGTLVLHEPGRETECSFWRTLHGDVGAHRPPE